MTIDNIFDRSALTAVVCVGAALGEQGLRYLRTAIGKHPAIIKK